MTIRTKGRTMMATTTRTRSDGLEGIGGSGIVYGLMGLITGMAEGV